MWWVGSHLLVAHLVEILKTVLTKSFTNEKTLRKMVKSFTLAKSFFSKKSPYITFTTFFPKNQQRNTHSTPIPRTPFGTFSTIAGLASYFYQHPNLRPLLPRFQRGHGTVVWKNIEGSARDIWPRPRGPTTHPGCPVGNEGLEGTPTRNVFILVVIVAGWGGRSKFLFLL